MPLQRLNRLIDRLIYPGDKETPESYQRGKFFVSFMMFFLVLNVMGIPYYISEVDLSNFEKVLYFFTIGSLISIFIIYPRYGYRVAFVNLHSLLANPASLFGTLTHTGGIFSADNIFTPAIAIFPFLIANRKSGIVWAIIGTLEILYMFWLGQIDPVYYKEMASQSDAHYYLFTLLFSVLFSVVVVTLFENMNNRLQRELTKTNSALRNSKLVLEERNREVTDSINYARRIQMALLPAVERITRFLPDSFVYYKPRNIVSGDFYWFHQLNSNQGLLVCADCTGHGVPGAMMSVIGSNSLNQLVIEDRVIEPELILDALDRKVNNQLTSSGNNSVSMQDGIDLVVLLIDKKGLTVRFASARRPVWIYRAGQLMELKGNRHSIGGGDAGNKGWSPYTHVYERNDLILVFTDGVTDQFGGPKEKKFGNQRLRDWMQGCGDKHADEMHARFISEMEVWQGEREQTDDMTMIGFRL